MWGKVETFTHKKRSPVCLKCVADMGFFKCVADIGFFFILAINWVTQVQSVQVLGFLNGYKKIMGGNLKEMCFRSKEA